MRLTVSNSYTLAVHSLNGNTYTYTFSTPIPGVEKFAFKRSSNAHSYGISDDAALCPVLPGNRKLFKSFAFVSIVLGSFRSCFVVFSVCVASVYHRQH